MGSRSEILKYAALSKKQKQQKGKRGAPLVIFLYKIFKFFAQDIFV